MPRLNADTNKNLNAQKAYQSTKNNLQTLNNGKEQEPLLKSFDEVKKIIENKLAATDITKIKEIGKSLIKAGMKNQSAAQNQNIELTQTKSIKKDQAISI